VPHNNTLVQPAATYESTMASIREVMIDLDAVQYNVASVVSRCDLNRTQNHSTSYNYGGGGSYGQQYDGGRSY